MIINTNMGSSTAARILAENTSALQKSLKRLSTGSKIASISDNAAGVAVANKLDARVTRLSASLDNVGNLISLSQTQDGYLEKVSSALERMSELAMLATDETKSQADLALYDKEFDELRSFLTSVSTKTFNGVRLFDNNYLSVTTDISTTGTAVSYTLMSSSLTVTAYVDVGSSGTFGVTTHASAASALVGVQSAISQLANDRASIGANLARLEAERGAMAILRDNLSAARSRIVDVDVAEESANFAKHQILVQSGTAMLAQANILPQSALRLIS